MRYYHVDLTTKAIIAGPFSAQDAYVKAVTHCGNPELLTLTDYGFYPLVESKASDDDDLGPPTVVGATVTTPTAPPTLAEVRHRKRARVAEICANKETNPITVGGQRFAAERDARTVLLELAGHCERNPTTSVVVKTKDGDWATLDLTGVRALVSAVAARTQACFAHEKALSDAIGTATRAQLRAMDLQAGWPT